MSIDEYEVVEPPGATADAVATDVMTAETLIVEVSATGHSVVDEVLGTLVDVEQLDLDARLPIFEQAHEALRQALTDAGDAPS
ncbi:MAG: hypothetical protein HZY75_09525 [Nocardioidaceae bacterium]|nr:MAG: hypothetical protein HZY75_09525 [Nocardioidaceae bacterium]